jgi:hypothetical protein
MVETSDVWQFLFFAVAAVVILLHTWRGWKSGPVRQVVTILALGCAYAAAFFGGPLLVPFLKPLGMPDLVLRVIGGALIGIVIFSLVTGVSALVFKKTSQQSIGVVRFGYGAMGAVLGAVFGVINVWVFFVLIRLFGTIAEHKQPAVAAAMHRRPPQAEEPQWVRGIVALKTAFEQGQSGAIAERVDPIPEKFYATMGKAMQMISNEQAASRFLAYPGIKPLTQNARIAALQNDPAILRDLLNRDFLALLRNEQLVKVANDPEVMALIGKFDVEKALDYAISKPDNREPVPERR